MKSIIQRYKSIYSNMFNFSGVETRKEFWINVLILFIGNILISFIGGILTLICFPLVLIFPILLILVVISSLALQARRYRDVGISPWWLLLTWIFWSIPSLVICCLPAQTFTQNNSPIQNLFRQHHTTNEKTDQQLTENPRLSLLESEISQLNQELNSSYAQIGKMFVEYTLQTNELHGIDITNILDIIRPQIKHLEELKNELLQTQKQINRSEEIQKINQLHKNFEREQEKLHQALALEIISQQEYDEKIILLKKRIQHFDKIKKIEKQFELEIITKEEMDIKINNILCQ